MLFVTIAVIHIAGFTAVLAYHIIKGKELSPKRYGPPLKKEEWRFLFFFSFMWEIVLLLLVGAILISIAFNTPEPKILKIIRTRRQIQTMIQAQP